MATPVLIKYFAEILRRDRCGARISPPSEQIAVLGQRLLSACARLRGRPPIDHNVVEILERYHVGRYPKVRRVMREERL